MTFEHLKIDRETEINERHRRQDPRPGFKPNAPKEHGRALKDRFVAASESIALDLGGYDDRKLVKIKLRAGERLPDLSAIPGVEVVSQEGSTVVLVFATHEGMGEFERRMTALARDGEVTRASLLYAIEDFDRWSPQDRTGKALQEQGFPETTTFVMDIELWPQERLDRRTQMIAGMKSWLEENRIEFLDVLAWPSLVMLRIRCDRAQAEKILNHRDVRTFDLPPRFGLRMGVLRTDLSEFPQLAGPEANSPGVTVLDSGLTTAHPMLANAIGEAQGFVHPDRLSADIIPHGHGTSVSGIALYGDIEAHISNGDFVPQLRLFSGKVFRDDGTDETTFVERAVEEAVQYYSAMYGCKVFNLSYGDLNKVYDGGHLRGLGYSLDRLTRELGVLFVTSTGNWPIPDLPDDFHSSYPTYLLAPEGRLLDPGTSLSAVTVGGIVHNTLSAGAQRYPNTIEDLVVANRGQPSPFTRCGPSVNGAIKPDFVEPAGNVALSRLGIRTTSGLGIVSFNSGYLGGTLFREDVGTSYAAPALAHKAARLLRSLPTASPNLIRALLGAHASWPSESVALLNPLDDERGRESLLNLIGYGRVNEEAVYASLNRVVTLISEEQVPNDRHHFYELPIPSGFWGQGLRSRTISIGLAYAPEVRTTRLDYRATRLSFSLVSAASLDAVTTAFRRNREQGMGERTTNRWISQEKRKAGTLQVSRWRFKQPVTSVRFFLVVTRQDANWSTVKDEPEPYGLCVVLDDRLGGDVNLHSEVKAILQVRARARIRLHT